MSYLGSWKIDDLLTFPCNTHAAATGAATDADSVPSYRVYEDETGTAILTGSMAKLDDANTTGFYSEQITLSAANGFEKGKCYTVYISAAVSSVTGTMSHTFQMEAEVDANRINWANVDNSTSSQPDVNVEKWNTTAVPSEHTAGYPIVTVKDGTGTGEIDTNAGAVVAVTTVTTLTNLPAITSNWLTAAGIAASALNGKGDWNIGKTGYALSSAGVQAIWDALTSALTTVSSIGKLLVDNINATISSRASQTSVDTVDDFLDSEIADIQNRLPAALGANGNLKADVRDWLGTAAATPTVAGVPEVDVTHLNGVAQSLLDLKDFADDGYDPSTNKVQGVVLVDTLTTYTSNTPQTGDSFARIGAAGAGLTDLGGMSTTMKAQVETEANDALVALNLDHIAGTATGIPAIPAGTYIDQMMDDGTATYDRTTDSLQAIRDRGDVAWATGSSAPTVTQIRQEMDSNSTQLAAIVEDTGTTLPAQITGLNNLSLAQVLAATIETGLTLKQSLRLIAAATAGKLSGAATATNTIRNAVADDKNRITATVDADGNRTAITYDLTD